MGIDEVGDPPDEPVVHKIFDSAAYLAYFYAQKYGTTLDSSLKEYKFLTQVKLYKGYNVWSDVLTKKCGLTVDNGPVSANTDKS